MADAETIPQDRARKPRWFGLIALAGAIYVTGFIYYK